MGTAAYPINLVGNLFYRERWDRCRQVVPDRFILPAARRGERGAPTTAVDSRNSGSNPTIVFVRTSSGSPGDRWFVPNERRPVNIYDTICQGPESGVPLSVLRLHILISDSIFTGNSRFEKPLIHPWRETNHVTAVVFRRQRRCVQNGNSLPYLYFSVSENSPFGLFGWDV